ncbi:hypothetical protein DFAR_710003 [Desulfarculales bacterium]
MATITTISPRCSATYRQSFWPPSARASPAPTSPWTGSILEIDGFATATAWRFKKMLRWTREATFVRATQWRITPFTSHALKCIALDTKPLAPVLKAFMTLEEHAT